MSNNMKTRTLRKHVIMRTKVSYGIAECRTGVRQIINVSLIADNFMNRIGVTGISLFRLDRINHISFLLNYIYWTMNCYPVYILNWMRIKEKEISWEEVIAYFPLIRHEPHRKSLQQFFVAAGTSLSSCYLSNDRGYTDRPTDTGVQQFFYCCVY
jgi:hypothetical protein